MARGRQIVQSFISDKSRTGNKKARQRWHGVTLGVKRSSDITANMFVEIENHLGERGWFAYGWAAKKYNIAERLYSNGVSRAEYSSFPTDQSHWDSFYCSRRVGVAVGYRVSGTSLLRIYVKLSKVGNIWLSGTDLGTDAASDMMIAAKQREPALSFFGLTGPQSEHIDDPETAMFGAAISANTLCVPLPDSVDASDSPQLRRTAVVSPRADDQFDDFLTKIR
ncbi:MAG: hypothetical protein AAFV43_15165 [Planctomycetota bacterium]